MNALPPTINQYSHDPKVTTPGIPESIINIPTAKSKSKRETQLDRKPETNEALSRLGSSYF
jgi:hypothetical protein